MKVNIIISVEPTILSDQVRRSLYEEEFVLHVPTRNRGSDFRQDILERLDRVLQTMGVKDGA